MTKECGKSIARNLKELAASELHLKMVAFRVGDDLVYRNVSFDNSAIGSRPMLVWKYEFLLFVFLFVVQTSASNPRPSIIILREQQLPFGSSSARDPKFYAE